MTRHCGCVVLSVSFLLESDCFFSFLLCFVLDVRGQEWQRDIDAGGDGATWLPKRINFTECEVIDPREIRCLKPEANEAVFEGRAAQLVRGCLQKQKGAVFAPFVLTF